MHNEILENGLDIVDIRIELIINREHTLVAKLGGPSDWFDIVEDANFLNVDEMASALADGCWVSNKYSTDEIRSIIESIHVNDYRLASHMYIQWCNLDLDDETISSIDEIASMLADGFMEVSNVRLHP